MKNSKIVGLTFNGSLKKAGVTFYFLFSFFFGAFGKSSYFSNLN